VGNIAQYAYLPRLRSGNLFQLQGVFDVNEELSRAVASEFSARSYASIGELISDEEVTAVFICSPPRFHCEAATAALQAGKHVLCEKPLAVNYREAQTMWDAARLSTARHMVNFSFRYDTAAAHFVDIVKSGVLGTIYHVSGTFSQGQWFSEDGQPAHERVDDAAWRYRAGGGVVLELGSHLVDLLRQCLGEVCRVIAWTESFRKDVPECENASGLCLKFDRGAEANVLISRLATGFREHRALEVFGSRGCLIFENGGLQIWTRNEPRWRRLMPPSLGDDSFLSAFHCAIHDPSKNVPGFWEGLKNNEVLDAVYESAHSGTAVDLPLGTTSLL